MGDQNRGVREQGPALSGGGPLAWRRLCSVDPAPLMSVLKDFDWPPGGGTFGEFAVIDELTEAESVFDACFKHLPEHKRAMTWMSLVRPGKSIPVHTDNARECDPRVHVPIETNNEAVFVVDGEEVQMEVGSAYLINPRLPHAVYNRGLINRTHLFFVAVRDAD